MPYASKAQQGYFHAHEAELQRQGVNVAEWDHASKGMKLPEHAKKKPLPHERVVRALAGMLSS